jgi:hypothetical protein
VRRCHPGPGQRDARRNDPTQSAAHSIAAADHLTHAGAVTDPRDDTGRLHSNGGDPDNRPDADAGAGGRVLV